MPREHRVSGESGAWLFRGVPSPRLACRTADDVGPQNSVRRESPAARSQILRPAGPRSRRDPRADAPATGVARPMFVFRRSGPPPFWLGRKLVYSRTGIVCGQRRRARSASIPLSPRRSYHRVEALRVTHEPGPAGPPQGSLSEDSSSPARVAGGRGFFPTRGIEPTPSRPPRRCLPYGPSPTTAMFQRTPPHSRVPGSRDEPPDEHGVFGPAAWLSRAAPLPKPARRTGALIVAPL